MEDAPLITGRGSFVGNLSFQGQLHMRIVRSAHAHAKLTKVNVEQAVASLGVVAVWTFADVAEVPPIEFRPTKVQGLEPYRQTILAKDHVRYVGEPVAAVFAENSYAAEDAADLVSVEVTELAPTLNARDSQIEPAVLKKEYGDVEDAFKRADETIALELSIGRHSGVPLECRGALARHHAATGILELHGATKRPHSNRDVIARMLKLDPARVQLYEGHIGGGFGVRGELYPEDFLVCLAAIRLGRPVKWLEDRQENREFFRAYKEQLKSRFRQLGIWMTTHLIDSV